MPELLKKFTGSEFAQSVTDSGGGGGGATSPTTLTSNGAAEIPLKIKAAAGQTANLLEVDSSAGSGGNLAKVDSAGRIVAPNATIGGLDVVAILNSRVKRIGYDYSSVTISNTTAESTIGSINIPANDAVAGDVYYLHLIGEIVQNGIACNYSFKLKIGSTTVMFSTPKSVGSASAGRPMEITAKIFVVSPTSQKVSAFLMVGAEGLTPNWMHYMGGGSNTIMLQGYGTSTEDLTTAKAVLITTEMSVANTNAQVKAHAVYMEKH